jgi:hypothetical protein
MARKLGEWLRGVGPRSLTDAIDQGEEIIRYGVWNAALAQERAVRDQLAQAAEGLNAIDDFRVDSEVEAMQLALQRLQGLLDDATSATQVAAAGPPGEQQAPGAARAQSGEQAGQQPGQQPGDQQAAQAGEQAARQGQQAGQQGQQGRQGQQAGQQGQPGQQGQQAGLQPGQQAGQPGNQPGGSRQPGRNSGGRFGGERDAGGGGRDEGRGLINSDRLRPEDARRFIDEDYRRWSDSLRDAQDLLPEENAARGRVDDISNEIDAMRRAFLRDGTVPDGAIVLDAVMNPLALAEAELRKELERKMSDSEFDVGDDAAVPVQYAERVADYFKVLSEKEPLR